MARYSLWLPDEFSPITVPWTKEARLSPMIQAALIHHIGCGYHTPARVKARAAIEIEKAQPFPNQARIAHIQRHIDNHHADRLDL